MNLPKTVRKWLGKTVVIHKPPYPPLAVLIVEIDIDPDGAAWFYVRRDLA